MNADPKLIEAVARAIAGANEQDFDKLQPQWTRDSETLFAQEDYLLFAHAALAAINASGEWWVAPKELETEGVDRSVELFDAMRAAYLAAPEDAP